VLQVTVAHTCTHGGKARTNFDLSNNIPQIPTHTKTTRSSTADRRSVCLRRKSAISENVVCDLDLQTHGPENVINHVDLSVVTIISFIKIRLCIRG